MRNRAIFVDAPLLRKPSWIRVRIPPGNAVAKLKSRLRENRLVTVCEEASCPNIHECFGNDTATFMILGEVCTRRCSFCDVAHGRPLAPDPLEPACLAGTIRDMSLRYVVITSVDRDDLRDGGAEHFADCTRAVRFENPDILIEILTPDFRAKGRMDRALETLAAHGRMCSTTTSKPFTICIAKCAREPIMTGRCNCSSASSQSIRKCPPSRHHARSG